MGSVVVYNLATGEEQTYVVDDLYKSVEGARVAKLTPLVNAYIESQFGASRLHDVLLRQKCFDQIIFGRWTAGLGDFSVRYP